MRCLRKGVTTDSLLGVCVVVHHGPHEHHHDHEEVTEGGLRVENSSSPEVVVVAQAWAHNPLGYSHTISDGSAAIGATFSRFLENRLLTSQTSLGHLLVVMVVLVKAVVDHDADSQ